MKKIPYFAAALTLFLMLHSCTKNEDLVFDAENLSQKQIELKIQKFNETMKLKNAGMNPVSVEEALWTIEATLNYNYAMAYYNASWFDFDSTLIELPYDGTNTTQNQMQQSYMLCVNYLRTHFNRINYNAKQMMMVNIEPKSYNQNSVLFKVISMVGIQQNLKSGNTINDWNPFGSTDWWEYANNLGKCNGYIGAGNAAVQIAQKINTRIAQELEAEEQAGHYDIYFTNIVASEEITGDNWPNPNDPNPSDHLFTFLIFWDWSSGSYSHTCLSPAEMNFHVNGTWQVMNTPTTQGGPKPGNKYPVSAFLRGNIITGWPIFYGHGAIFSFGKKWKMPWQEPGLNRIQNL